MRLRTVNNKEPCYIIKVNSMQNKISMKIKIYAPNNHKNDRKNRIVSMNMVTDRMSSYLWRILNLICYLSIIIG